MPQDSMNVTAVSRVVLDEFPGDDGEARVVLGGSGFWAAFGARVWIDGVTIATRTGPDIDPHIPRLQALGIDQSGFVSHPEPTSRTVIRYPRPEEREETSVYGWDHAVRMRAMPADFSGPVANSRAFYVFRGWHPGFWPAMLSLRARTGALLLWEIPEAICVPSELDSIRKVLPFVDVLSLNLQEGRQLLGHRAPDSVVELLHASGVGIVTLRLGADGCLVSDTKRRVRARPAPSAEVVDVTGGGNAFSGGFLAALLCRPGDLEGCTRAAMTSAALAIRQIGPPGRVDRRAAGSVFDNIRIA